ncbi:MAG TPA: sigma-54-dependent Fis family transcriptional regulator [Devosia sp.]|nr:sigma-54-dependent Fis family transcriptional regulator [Devosia sp.]
MRSADGSGAGVNFLVIESDAASFRVMKNCLEKEYGADITIQHATSGKLANSLLRAEVFDVILADVESLSGASDSAEENISRVSRVAGSALVIALSEGGSVSLAVAAMRAGAHDYVSKPINFSALAARIAELGHRHGNARALHAESENFLSPDFEGFVGASQQMRIIYEQIERIAPSPAPVFITGESGTGKEVCAEALHRRSTRADKPFVAINCGAIPRELMESEIFGVVRGAYTGAAEDRAGAAERAQGGVLFLDEIGEMDLGLQAKLLRFLQTGSVSRVGESVARGVDVRVICATNSNPMQMIAEKKFREDLFYRLHVLPIHLPPLRQRPTDILPLALTFLKRYSDEEKKQFESFAQSAADMIVAREWPGNVRQLQNLIRRVVVLFDGVEVTADMISAADIEAREVRLPLEPSPDLAQPVRPMWHQEQRIIEEALARFNGNIAKAAAALEISPSTIYRKQAAWEQMLKQQVA